MKFIFKSIVWELLRAPICLGRQRRSASRALRSRGPGLILAFVLLGADAALAAPGSLDQGFRTGGLVEVRVRRLCGGALELLWSLYLGMLSLLCSPRRQAPVGSI